MSVRFRICLIAWIAVMAITVLSQHASAQVQELTPVPEESIPGPPIVQHVLPVPDDEWYVSIEPAQKLSTMLPNQPVGCENCDAVSKAAQYQRVYDSIPFNRAEFNRNPTYRHDAAMEILTGNARHQTIVRHDVSQPVSVVPTQPAFQPLNPSRYGYLRPALRLNYYRYFPSLNPYVNIWNYSGAF